MSASYDAKLFEIVNEATHRFMLAEAKSKGLIKAEWGVSDNNRKARYYKLTAAGQKQLAAEHEHWSRITAGINLVLGEA